MPISAEPRVNLTAEEFRRFCRSIYDDAYQDGWLRFKAVEGDEDLERFKSRRSHDYERSVSHHYIEESATVFANKEIVTCVYCGHAYPPGTPTANHPLLTRHIAQCEKHPMRAVTEQRDKLLALCERFLRTMPHHRRSEDLENEFVRVVRDCGGNQ